MPVRVQILPGEVIVRRGESLTPEDIEKVDALGLGETRPDVASLFGWFLLAVLIVGMMLGWMWRFRPKLWHRDNALVLTGILVVGATLALKLTAGRAILQFFLPTAAIGMLLAILLDASLATVVIALVAIIGGAVNGLSLEFATYVFLGGMAGHRRHPSWRPDPGLRPGRGRRVRRERRGRDDLLAARRPRRARRPRAVVRLGRLRGGLGRGRGRHVRRPRLGLRDPHRVPAARAGQPVAAAAAPPPRRDARHLPPLAHGRQPGGACGRGHRRRPAGHARRGVLPRHRQAREPARVHREPGRRREHPRPARPRRECRDPQAARRRRHRPRLQEQAAEGAHRLHPAAPRDRDHELLLRAREGAGGRAVRRHRDSRGREGRGGRRPANRSGTSVRSHRRARPR